MKKKFKKNVFKVIMLTFTFFCSAFVVYSMAENIVSSTRKTVLPLSAEVSIPRGKQVVSMSLRDSDVKQVLRMLADKAGLNIIFHSSVTGTTTLDLVNVTLNDAFKMVLQVNELSYVMDGNALVIMSNNAGKNLNFAKQNINIIPVKYVEAGLVADFLNNNIFSISKPGLSNSKIVVVNPQQNELMVFGTKNDVLMAQKIVDMLDVKPIVTTYKINHTIPSNMANLICSSMFSTNNSEKKNSGSTSEMNTGAKTVESALKLEGSAVACKISGQSPLGNEGLSANISQSQLSNIGGQNVATSTNLQSFKMSALSVLYADRLGTVTLVGGTKEQANLIADFIKKNDKKAPQALVEISVVELNEKDAKNISNEFSILGKNFAITFNGDDGTKMGPKTTSPGSSIYNGHFALEYYLNYIMRNTKARVLANPKIIATNGQESIIDLSNDYVKKVESEFSTTTIGLVSTPIVTRTYEIGNDNGMKIALTPFISADGYVSLNLKPDYSTVKEEVKVPLAVGLTPDLVATLLQRRNLDLKNVRVRDGETLIIGGLINEEERVTNSKIPFLGDLPGVGVLFRSAEKTKVQNELMILVSPKIIQDTEDLVNTESQTESL